MLIIKIGRLVLKSPVIMMSGIFSYGEEDIGYINYEKIGAVVTKTITLLPYKGNPQPRIWETGNGMLNSIGLQNPGIRTFVSRYLPKIKQRGIKTIVSISGQDSFEVLKIVEVLSKEGIDIIELNLSCPNVYKDKPMISQSAEKTYEIVRDVKKKFGNITLIAKLSPNVTDISEIAVSAEKAGADALSLINTVKGLSVDVEGRRVVEGGLSGPQIKPVGMRAVYEVFKKVNVPLIGTGGILKGRDALEYLLVGASAVGVGSGFFSNPLLIDEIYDTVRGFLSNNKYKKVADIVGLFNEKKEKTSSETKKGR